MTYYESVDCGKIRLAETYLFDIIQFISLQETNFLSILHVINSLYLREKI